MLAILDREKTDNWLQIKSGLGKKTGNYLPTKGFYLKKHKVLSILTNLSINQIKRPKTRNVFLLIYFYKKNDIQGQTHFTFETSIK